MRRIKLTQEQLSEEIRDQKEWIAEHGGNVAGYIKRYGDPGVARTVVSGETTHEAPMYGDGGTRIFEADLQQLQTLESEYSERFGVLVV